MNTPLLGILMMLFTVGLVVLATVVLVQARLKQRPAPWRRMALGAAGWATVYLAMLLGSSLTSRERQLGLNEDKQFCGFYIDCHMQVAVTDVDTVRQIDTLKSGGLYYVVKLRVSSSAVRAHLRLLDPQFVLRDAQGREYHSLPVDRHDSLTRLIGPEESFTTTVVFDVPAAVQAPRLYVTEGIWADRFLEFFLIGDEDSVLHERTSFRIDG